jgi:hypothetical protein
LENGLSDIKIFTENINGIILKTQKNLQTAGFFC